MRQLCLRVCRSIPPALPKFLCAPLTYEIPYSTQNHCSGVIGSTLSLVHFSGNFCSSPAEFPLELVNKHDITNAITMSSQQWERANCMQCDRVDSPTK